MGAEAKSPPKQHTHQRPVSEPHEPRPKRRAGNVAAVAIETTTAVGASMHHPPRQLDEVSLLPDGIASSSASDVPSSTAASIPATPRATTHICRHCQKRFRSPDRLAQHERVHSTRDTAFYCTVCPKQFDRQSYATEHERMHTGEKPYGCSMCPKRFSQKSQIVPHERTHTGEKPYACEMCPMRFNNKSHVAPHERAHTSE